MNHDVHWQRRQAPADANPLVGDTQSSVVIVGGGITGLSCAQRLRAAGMSVTLVERDFCGSGASGRSSGFITPASEIDLHSLISNYGEAQARHIWNFVTSGVEVIRRNILEHGFDCDHQVQDSLFVANSRAGPVDQEHAARLQMGYLSRRFDRNSMTQALGTRGYVAGVRYPDTFAIDPFAYCRALREWLLARGVTIHEASPVLEVHVDGVDTANGKVRAEHVVVCTDRFIPEFGVLEDDIFHAQTFLAITTPLDAADMRAIFPDGKAMVWDSDLVYNYFRATGEDRMLLGGGQLLHTYARKPVRSLDSFTRHATRYFRSKFPNIELHIDGAWSGMLGLSKDLLPIMAPDPRSENIWYVGAATGLPWGTALGIYAADRILDRRSEFDEAFSPARKFLIGHKLQAVLSTPLTYAISNAVAKLA